MSEQEVPVLVVGGSLVGLTTSVLLASHGVRHMLIEKHRGTAIHPRAAWSAATALLEAPRNPSGRVLLAGAVVIPSTPRKNPVLAQA
ncbi:MAG TPA: FAD-dependent monooxygenase [Steroidobacteraceae bacterium]|nr:FAD-dependent monooxygenase [Steroidobacteraceae bacterium]